jgi:hypothetical protein
MIRSEDMFAEIMCRNGLEMDILAVLITDRSTVADDMKTYKNNNGFFYCYPHGKLCPLEFI